jgi:two-component system chemotaxis response regulator CheB
MAASRVLDGLAPPLDAALLVLIHQQPDRESELVSILQGRCRLPVAVAANRRALQPATVLVVPPGRHLLITPDARVLLIASGAFPPYRPSADLLLATMATALGPRAIAVVLSGGGHDAATGATAIHACGGTVLATDEATSASFGMPSAAIARAAVVDRVVALDDVAGSITELVRAPQMT